MNHESDLKIRMIKMLQKKALPLSVLAGVLLIFALFQNCGSSQSTPASTSSTASATAGSTLVLSPSSTSVAFGSSITFSATGGSGTGYTYSMMSGSGTITGAGAYVAPQVTETDEIKVTDSAGNIAYGYVYVSSSSSSSATSTTSATVTFMAQDGTGTSISGVFIPGTYLCSTAVFGYDPSYGHTKGCYAGSTLVAVEGGSFIVSSTGTVTSNGTITTTATVVYRSQDGTGSSLSKVFTVGTYACSNATFGTDPDVNHVKACYVNSALVVA